MRKPANASGPRTGYSVANDYAIRDYLGDGVPVTLLADRPIRRWSAVVKRFEDLALGVLITLILLPVLVLCFVMGVLPTPFLSKMQPSIERVLARLPVATAAVAQR